MKPSELLQQRIEHGERNGVELRLRDEFELMLTVLDEQHEASERRIAELERQVEVLSGTEPRERNGR